MAAASAITTNPKAEAAAPSPSPSLADGQINYNFVVGMYTIASVIFVMLLILDKVVEVPQVEGFWIIFAPFIPCLLVSLVVRSRWLRRRSRKVPSKEE